MDKRHLRPECVACGVYLDDDDEACRRCLAWKVKRAFHQPLTDTHAARSEAQRDILLDHFAGKRRRVPVLPPHAADAAAD